MAELHRGIPLGTRVAVVMRDSGLKHEGTLASIDAETYTLVEVFTLGTEAGPRPSSTSPWRAPRAC
jgi:hypothetical protein